MDNYCVYCHTSPSNKRYVGISVNPQKRWNSGRGYEKNYLFYRAIQKYGWDNFNHEIIADNLTADEAKELEIMLISSYKLTDPSFGYNLRDGGDGPLSENSKKMMSASRVGNKNSVGRRISEKSKQKISNSLREYYRTHNPAFLGRKHSEETIQKMRSRITSEKTRQKMRKNHRNVCGENNPSARKIRQLSIIGEEIAVYDYSTIAAKKYGLDLSSIIKCCRGKHKTCGGFRWEYV